MSPPLLSIPDHCYNSPPPEPNKKPKPQFTPERYKTIKNPLPRAPEEMAYRQTRDPCLDVAHRALVTMADVNQKSPLPPSEMQPVKQIAQDLTVHRNQKDILMFMKTLSEFVVYETKGIFFGALKDLIQLCPELNYLFLKTETHDPIEGPSLKPFAINDLCHFYEEEFHFSPGVLSCQPISKLTKLVSEFIRSDTSTMRGFVIHNDYDPFDGHVVPVFIIKYQGMNHLFIFDSRGHTVSNFPNETVVSRTLDELLEYFYEESEESKKISLYSYQIQRQFSEVGCATFSLLDLKNLYERHAGGFEHIVDFYRSQKEAYRPKSLNDRIDSSVPIYELNVLPPEMMKATQSRSQICHYQDRPPTLNPELTPVFLRSLPAGETCKKVQDLMNLRSAVNDSVRVSPTADRTRNLYVEKKRFSDIVILICRHFVRSAKAQDQISAPKSEFPAFGDDKEVVAASKFRATV
jgi:hypothetical protein